jgi:hypothetical protein
MRGLDKCCTRFTTPAHAPDIRTPHHAPIIIGQPLFAARITQPALTMLIVDFLNVDNVPSVFWGVKKKWQKWFSMFQWLRHVLTAHT